MLKKSHLFFIVIAVLGFSCQSMQLEDLDEQSPLRAQYLAGRANFDAQQDQWARGLMQQASEPSKAENTLATAIHALDNDQDLKNEAIEEAQTVAELIEGLAPRPKLSRIPYAKDIIEKVVPCLKYLATKVVVDNKIDFSFEIPNDTQAFIAMYKLMKTTNQEMPEEFIYQRTISNKHFNEQVKSETKPDRSPLMLAMLNNDHAAFEALVSDEAVDPNSVDRYDNITPLIWAAHQGLDYYAERLLGNQKTDLHKKDYFGRSALSHATQEGHTSIIQMLLRRGAETADKDVSNKTVYDLASNQDTLFTLVGEVSKNVAGNVQAQLLLSQDMEAPVSIEFVVKEENN